jgi:hypothetical protein|tara:strand:- start:106 stop:462 length:357 start_codon:yes stop_codon:yes gene_type:complete
MAVSTRVKEVNTGSAASSTALVSSKKFDFGSPDIQKRFRKITMLYKASSDVTVTVFLDGDAFASADATITFPSNSAITSVSRVFSSVGKIGYFNISCAASNLQIESIDIDYDLLGSNP